MPRARAFSILTVAFLLAAVFGPARVHAADFETANQLYDAGKYAEARDEYQKLIDAGKRTPNTFYNLANAEFRLGEAGKAILNYERALKLQPSHPEAKRNLELARSRSGASVRPRDWIDRLLPHWRPNVFAIAGAVSVWVMLYAGAGLLTSRRPGRGGLWAITIFSFLLAAYSALALWRDWEDRSLAIIVAKQAVARLAPADRAGTAEILLPGSQVRVLSERGEWIYCALPGHGLGWLPARTLERIRPTGS